MKKLRKSSKGEKFFDGLILIDTSPYLLGQIGGSAADQHYYAL
jgi:hypothetical protein